MMSTAAEIDAILRKVEELFTPDQPIALPELLAGRLDLLPAVRDAVRAAGQHVVLFGDRGVGKTSIARVTASYVGAPAAGGGAVPTAVFTSCSSTDEFSDIWTKAFQEIVVLTLGKREIGFRAQDAVQEARRLEVAGIASPNDVRLQILALRGRVVFFIDEFDRVQSVEARRLMTDTMKLLSDSGTPATVVLVGVAETVTDLLTEHESIGRNLAQILVPPMSQKELSDLVRSRYDQAGLMYEDEIPSNLGRLAQGYPHYAHLLGLWSARSTLRQGRTLQTMRDVRSGVGSALERSMQGLSAVYERAIESSYPGNLFKEVLLACALAQKDLTGRFRAAAAGPELSRIMGRRYEQAAYQSHLGKFTETTRGPVLRRTGRERQYRYKFIDPQLVPYVVLRGQDAGLAPLGPD